MKCGNCGNDFKNSITCPLCGHRIAKVSHCNVCGTVIHRGQGQCIKCGNPTIYQKREDINKKYRITDNQEYLQHSQKTHVYQSQEMYDYKSSDLDIKKRFDEARAQIFNTKNKLGKRNIKIDKKYIAPLVSLVIVVFTLFVDFFSTTDLDSGMVELEQMEISENNNDLMIAGNYQKGGFVDLKGDDVYLKNNLKINKFDRSCNERMEINFENEIIDGYIYKEDSYLYYSENREYKRYNENTQEIDKLFSGENVLPIKKHRFLYTEESGGLYLYENGKSKKISVEKIEIYSFDFKNELVYFSNLEKVTCIDLEGNLKKEYELYVGNNLYVDSGIIYYNEQGKICSYDTNKHSIKMLLTDENVYQFIITEHGIVYLNYDNELYYYLNDEIYLISNDVYDFNVLGEYVIYRGYINDGWYISDGQKTSEFLE